MSQALNKLTKLRQDARTMAVVAIAFGSGMTLIAVGILFFFGPIFKTPDFSSDKVTANLASAVKWFVFLLIPCNLLTLITGMSTLRYLRAEQSGAAKPEPA
jgi:hypothetical protein